jgi:hypothetical protein
MPPDTEKSTAQTEMAPGGKCEQMPATLTQEQLRKLRHEVEQGQIPKNPEEYNFPETKIEPTDTVATILGKIFTEKGKSAPASGISRIELALSTQGLDLRKLNAAAYRVESGKLIITAKDGTIVSYDLLPWKALEAHEGGEVLSEHQYELGSATGAAAVKEEPDKIEAGVDATEHKSRIRDAKWYEAKAGAAKTIMEIYNNDKNRFDANTQSLIAANEDILKDLAAQTEFSPKKFRANFEKKYGKDKLFGANGVYNLLLAFQRALDVYGGNSSKLASPDTKVLIALFIGKTVQKIEERFVKAIKGIFEDTDEGGEICTPETEPTAVPGKGGTFMRVETKPGSLAPTADQFNEALTPEVASELLIRTYKSGGLEAFRTGLLTIAARNPDKADTVLQAVFEKLRTGDRETAVKLMAEIAQGQASEVKKQLDASLQEAIDKEPNPENKKVLKLMKLLNDIKYNAENPEATPDTTAREKEGGTNEMRAIMSAIAAIDGGKLTGEYKEFYETTKKSIEDRLRQTMASDILETQRNNIEASILDRTKKDTTFVRSLEELRVLSRGDLAKALRNEGALEWADTDSEVYLSSCHVMEAMRLYLTYLYTQEINKGTKIPNPLKWALEQVKNGTKIQLPAKFAATEGDYIEDVLTGEKTPVAGGTVNPDDLFVAKDAELRMFDEYQKGEERIGEMSVWNLAPLDWKEGAITGAEAGTVVLSVPLALGGAAFGKLNEWTGVSDKLRTDKGAFMAGKKSMLESSDDLFSADFAGLMSENGSLGAVERLELNKIMHLRVTKNYDEARALAARIFIDKMPPVTDDEISKKATELSKDYDTKIRAQVRLNMENDERFKDLSYDELEDAISKATKEAIEEKAYLMLVGDAAGKMDDKNFTEFEKQALKLFNVMNGNAGVPISDESMDVVISVSKVVVEIVAIELVTAGAGSFIAGAAGARAVAEAGATGLTVARATGATSRAFRAGEALATSAGRAGRLTRILARNRYVARGVDWMAGGRTVGARAARSFAHATAFSEEQHLLHGSTLQVIDDPKRAAWEVGTTALTIWGLGATQRFMRGQLAEGARMPALVSRGERVGQGSIEAGIQTGGGRLGRTFDAAIIRPSARVGEFLAARSPVTRNLAEIGTEIMALHGLGKIERWGAVQTGMISQTQMEAMEDPETWHELAQTAGVVLGLRAWGIAKQPPVPEGPKQLTGEVLGERKQLTGKKLGEEKLLPEISTIEDVGKLVSVRSVIFDAQRVSTPEQITVARQYLELLNTQIKLGNYNKESLEEIVRRLYDIQPEKVLNETTWNRLTIQRVAPAIHPDKGGDPGLFSALITFTTSAKRVLLQ